MHPNQALIEQFYRAFQKRDAEGMIACYHRDVTFSDSVFVGLDAAGARAMWRMLCERGKDLTLEFSDVRADDSTGSAHWEAHYSFSTTGRHVHNVIDASFEFKDGKIIRHTDRFDLWRWTRMALGPAGILLGWTPFLQGKVRAMAKKGLAEYMEKNPERAGG
ncbi:nuclear transport factor 2 family protein [Polyangium sp. y55x31]|uniref:nuclear transport factor 2 family protein n=1 Tax=Polyangium sp. y55x31 TaxID=3042688 RepID=UPI002482F37D|nr:nuclear transport factor 2 family protein [Polyangium sp. y55x31]MDI1478324.1 nuclear transport factor 2 family protein [Polyangium sp. y55x31]